MKTYFKDGTITIRSMETEDAGILYKTYLSYGWHPQIETYKNYYKDQEEGTRLVFIAEYNGRVSGQCTLALNPKEGPWAGKVLGVNYWMSQKKRLPEFLIWYF